MIPGIWGAVVRRKGRDAVALLRPFQRRSFMCSPSLDNIPGSATAASHVDLTLGRRLLLDGWCASTML
jgi:hypothetical protein